VASLRVKNLVPERRAQMKQIREHTSEYLEKKGISFIPRRRSGAEFAQAVAYRKIIGRPHLAGMADSGSGRRGTKEEMAKFKVAIEKVMG